MAGQAGAAPPCGNPNPPAACTPTPTATASPTATATATPTPTPTSAPTPTASASPVPQMREDQIFLSLAGATDASGPAFSFLGGGPTTRLPGVALDAARYSASTLFRFEVILGRGTNTTNCLRLFDLTADRPVAGSDICITVGPDPLPFTRFRSGSFALTTGLHEYTIQGEFVPDPTTNCCGVDVSISRIIAEWTEQP